MDGETDQAARATTWGADALLNARPLLLRLCGFRAGKP